MADTILITGASRRTVFSECRTRRQRLQVLAPLQAGHPRAPGTLPVRIIPASTRSPDPGRQSGLARHLRADAFLPDSGRREPTVMIHSIRGFPQLRVSVRPVGRVRSD